MVVIDTADDGDGNVKPGSLRKSVRNHEAAERLQLSLSASKKPSTSGSGLSSPRGPRSHPTDPTSLSNANQAMMLDAAVQQHPIGHSTEGGFREELQVVRHQLDCYKAAAKQLGVLLMHRNKEIAVLLQEMQLDTSSSVDGTQADALIPAIWGKSTPGAVQMYELDDYLTYQSAVDQAAPELPASQTRGASNPRGPPSHQVAVAVGHVHPQDGSPNLANAISLHGILGNTSAAAPSHGDTVNTALRAGDNATEPVHALGMAEDDFGGVQFSEVFWVPPEWEAPFSPNASAHGVASASQAAIAWLERLGLDAASSDASALPGESTNDYQGNIHEQMAASGSAAGQLDVAISQVRALGDLVLSMQALLREARDKQSALSEDLRHASACVQHLQLAEQAWELEQALQAADMGARTTGGAEVQDSDAAQLQVTEAALHDALRREGQLMAEVISLGTAAPKPEEDVDVPWMSCTAGGDETPELTQHAASASAAAQHSGSAEAEEPEKPGKDVTPSAAGYSQAAAKPAQLRHAHSVIADLSARLAELECCNALLEDQLATGASDLIKSGPQDGWLADSFPWDVRASAEDEGSLLQDSTSAKAEFESMRDAGPTASPENLAMGSLADDFLTAGQLGDLSDTELAEDVGSAFAPAGHPTGAQGGMTWADDLTDQAPVLSRGPHLSRDRAKGDVVGDVWDGEGQRAASMLHHRAAPQLGHLSPTTASKNHASSALATPGPTAKVWPKATPEAPHTAIDMTDQMSFSRLSAAEEQSNRLAATHAELERCLLHAQNQLRDFAGAASTDMPAPAAQSFHAAQEALTQAVAEVRSTGAQQTPELLLGRASAGSLSLSMSSQGSPGRLEITQAPRSAAGMESEVAAWKARLARTAEQLADSERCREHLQQQLLDVGEARHKAHLHGLQDSPGLRAEAADSTANLAWLADQHAESERCRDSLQQQLTDLEDANLTTRSSPSKPAGQVAEQSTAHDNLKADQALSGSAELPVRRDIASGGGFSSRGGSQASPEREHGITLEAATSEVAALRVAMTQSENIFLDLESQLRAAFERQAASQQRIAALGQELEQAGTHARRASVVQADIAHDDRSALVPFVQHQSSALDVTIMEPQSQEAGAIVLCGSGSTQKAAQRDMPADTASHQMQVLTVQLRAALQQVSDAERVIKRLHDQPVNQHVLITELRLGLPASGQLDETPDGTSTLQATDVKAGTSSKALQGDNPISNSLLKVAIAEEIPLRGTSQQNTAGILLLIADVSKALQVPSATTSASGILDLQKAAKPIPSSARISQLAIMCALIAGQSECPEVLFALMMSGDSTPVSSSQSTHKDNVPAQFDKIWHGQGDAVSEHTASAHSALQRIRENPLFLQGGSRSSNEESEGPGAEDEAHHRTVRGREAQQIMQRLKSSYSHRSMSAPDAALPTGVTGKEAAGRRAVGRAAGRRRSSRQAQQRAKPWSLPSLKRALAEQRRGSVAASSGSFRPRSSSYGSMLLDGEEEDAEVLDTIYANWGEIDQKHFAGERDDSKELTASLAERCAYLQEALQEATCQLADARAAEERLQSQNSILRAENSALTARLTELKQEQQRHKPAQREQAAYKPASRATAAPSFASSSGAGALQAPARADASHRALTTGADAGAGQPSSKYAWELQDLHLRMAAAIAQIRELEADKAKVTRQLISACAGGEGIPWPAVYAGQSAR